MPNGYDSMGLITLALVLVSVCKWILASIWERETREWKVGKR